MIGSGMLEGLLHFFIERDRQAAAEFSKKIEEHPVFVRHSPDISSHGFEWLEVETADRKAMTDIEESDYHIFKYRRPIKIKET